MHIVNIFQPQFALKKGHGHAAFLFIKVVDKIAKLSKISNQFDEKQPELMKHMTKGDARFHKYDNKAPSNLEGLKVLNVHELTEQKSGKTKPNN